jgi:hypothetical protein
VSGWDELDPAGATTGLEPVGGSTGAVKALLHNGQYTNCPASGSAMEIIF